MCDCIRRVSRSVDDSRREAGDRTAGPHAEISVDHAETRVGHGRRTQNAESIGGVKYAGVNAKCKERERETTQAKQFHRGSPLRTGRFLPLEFSCPPLTAWRSIALFP